ARSGLEQGNFLPSAGSAAPREILPRVAPPMASPNEIRSQGPGLRPGRVRATLMRTADRRAVMENRLLGASGFQVPVLSLGTATFGGEGAFAGFGASDVAEATRLVGICLDAGLTMFDSADAYSAGRAEEILGRAIRGRRDEVIISTKSAFRVGPGPN